MFLKCYYSALTGSKYRITAASAALSYYLTMAIFPLLIILYSLLGSNYETALKVLEYFQSVLPGESLEFIRNFLVYVSENNSIVLLYFALTVIVATASAAFRSIQTTIGVMQGGSRYHGFACLFFSVVLSLLFVLLMYVCIVVLFFSENLIDLANRYLPFIHLKKYWSYLRFLVLFFLAFHVIYLVFQFSRRKDIRYGIFWGTLLSTFWLVGVCYVFSLFISKSVKYPLVYSSLSSVILLMFWMYSCSYSVYCGALFNVILNRKKLGITLESIEQV